MSLSFLSRLGIRTNNPDTKRRRNHLYPPLALPSNPQHPTSDTHSIRRIPTLQQHLRPMATADITLTRHSPPVTGANCTQRPRSTRSHQPIGHQRRRHHPGDLHQQQQCQDQRARKGGPQKTKHSALPTSVRTVGLRCEPVFWELYRVWSVVAMLDEEEESTERERERK